MKNQTFLKSYWLKNDEKLKNIRSYSEKTWEYIYQSRFSQEQKNHWKKKMYTEKLGPKIKSDCKKYDCLNDKNQILTDKVEVYKKILGPTEGILDMWWNTIGICKK